MIEWPWKPISVILRAVILRNPTQSGQCFRCNPTTDFDGSRPPLLSEAEALAVGDRNRGRGALCGHARGRSDLPDARSLWLFSLIRMSLPPLKKTAKQSFSLRITARYVRLTG